MTDDKKVVSTGGSHIYQHSQEKTWEVPQGEESLKQISNHIERHLGPVRTVFHEMISDAVHIDVHLVQATSDFPFSRLVTSGMSDRPMPIPAEAKAPRYTELLITLPAAWQLNMESFKDENWYWPIRLLKWLARFPHKYETWLGRGHTIPNGDPPKPYAGNTKLCGAIVLPAATAPRSFSTLRVHAEKEVTFYSVVPLYREEIDLKLSRGTNALLGLFNKHSIDDIFDPSRRNVAKKRFGLF
jgi:hypothetical protein